MASNRENLQVALALRGYSQIELGARGAVTWGCGRDNPLRLADGLTRVFVAMTGGAVRVGRSLAVCHPMPPAMKRTLIAEGAETARGEPGRGQPGLVHEITANADALGL